MSQELFRPEALKKFSSPEQLDQLPKTVSPMTWVSLLAVFLLLSFGIGWLYVGKIPVKISGKGILFKGEIFKMVSFHSGILSELKVQPGDKIEKNQIIGTLVLPPLQEEIFKIESQLSFLMKEKEQQKPIKKWNWKINQKNQELCVLKETMERNSKIISPHSGQIIEMTVKKGDWIHPGQQVLKLEKK